MPQKSLSFGVLSLGGRMVGWLFRNPYLLPFFVSFYLVLAFIIDPSVSLVRNSPDAESIWQTIITFREDNITPSYVLYKGFLSVYPYVWLYQASLFSGSDQFFFVKIYHALLFSITAAFAVPHIVGRMLGTRINLIKNLIFVSILFFSLRSTLIFDTLMVDLPTWSFYVFAVCFILKFHESEIQRRGFLYLVLSGLFIGLSLASSGQYSLASYFLIIFVLYSVYRKQKAKKILTLIIPLTVFLVGVLPPKLYDLKFHHSIVQPMREAGEWLPTGSQWAQSGMTRLMHKYKFEHGYHWGSNRGLAVLKSVEQENFEERLDLIEQGGGVYTISEYANIVKTHAVDFLVMWASKGFLAISFDGGSAKLRYLLVSYTAFFIIIFLSFVNVRTIGAVLDARLIIYLSIISTIAAPVLLHVEMRYVTSLYSFMLAFAIHQNEVGRRLVEYCGVCRRTVRLRGLEGVSSLPFPWMLVAYVMFVLFSLVLYGAFLEMQGADPSKVLLSF